MATQLNFNQPLLSATILNWPHRRASDDISHAETLFALIQHSPTGVILLDGAATVVLVNRAAQHMLDLRDAFMLDNGSLIALRKSDGVSFNSMISLTINGATPQAMLLPRKSGKRDYLVQIISLNTRHKDFGQNRHPVVALLICDPDAAVDVPASVLEQLFGLTAAEARVAQRVAHGDSADTVAASLGVSRNAIKYHLKTIYRKTQTNRQTQLARLLAQLSWSTAFMDETSAEVGALMHVSAP